MLDKYIIIFDENINGLRDFISLIGPFIEKHHQQAVEEHNKIIEAFEYAKQIETEENGEVKAELEDKIKAVFDGETIKALDIKEVEKTGENGEKEGIEQSFVIAVPKSQTTRVENAFRAPRKTNYQKELLYKNSLIGLLSSVEWFYSQVLHYYYDRFPSAAGIKKKTLTLEDLKTFNSVEDAEQYLIDSKIEEIFRGNFEAWITVLKEEVGLKLPYIKPFYNELIEVYQRRNLLVHNGGIVNSIYIAKVQEKNRSDVKIGDKLKITEEYLDNAICKLHLVFTLIAAELWKKLESSEEKRALMLNDIVYREMLNKRWETAEWFSCFIKDDDELKSRVKTVGQLNNWLCKKQQNKIEEVKKEIAKADFSDKSLRYQLAIAALNDDIEEFFEMLPETLSTKSLEVEELLEFPIFDNIRKLERFNEFKMSSPEFKELVQLSEKIADDQVEATEEEVVSERLKDIETTNDE